MSHGAPCTIAKLTERAQRRPIQTFRTRGIPEPTNLTPLLVCCVRLQPATRTGLFGRDATLGYRGHASIRSRRVTTGSETMESMELEQPRESGLLARGEVLGRYEILFPIASGGMATVYAARLLGAGVFQKPVALKRMLPHLASDPHFVTMFMDEAALCARVQSPHVVSIIELSRHDDQTLFMALELVVGVSLRELFDACEQARKPLSMRVACAVLVQAASGLHDAHEACSASGKPLGIVHRDMSPHNVLVGIDGRARISDFGIARAIERLSATQTGELKGKLPYFSPEQMRCADLDARSDVFSLGIVAWELLSGQRLFAASNPLATAQAVAAKYVTRLDVIRPEVPSAVADVVAQALERELWRRCPSAESFALALRHAAESSCGLGDAREVAAAVRERCAPSIDRVEQGLAQAMSEPTAARPALPKKRPTIPSHWALLLLLGAALGAGALLATGARQWRDKSERSLNSSETSQGQPRAAAAPAVAASKSADTVTVTPEPAPSLPRPTALTESGLTEPDGSQAEAKADAGTPAKSQPRVNSARRRAVQRRRSRPTKAPGVNVATPRPTEGGALLRGIDEFDQERER